MNYLTGSNGVERYRTVSNGLEQVSNGLEGVSNGKDGTYPIARAIRAARSVSRTWVWLVPENTSLSPVLASRTWTTIGPAGVFAAPWLSDPSAAELRFVAARAGFTAPMAVTARPAAPAVAAPCSRERLDRRRPVDPKERRSSS
jgi:hypothetical protein